MDSLSNHSDEYIARECLRDIQFLTILIDRYKIKLENYIRRKSNATKEDRDDMLQNVFIKVYKNINDFDSSLSFSSWVYRITHNEVIDWYRREKRHLGISFEEDTSLINKIAAEIDIEKESIQEETRKKIQEKIKLLSTDYQEILQLRFFEEKTYEEISDILMIPQGTVAIRINRAKKKLQELLNTNE